MGIEDETTDEVDMEVVTVPVERSEVGGVVEVTASTSSITESEAPPCVRYEEERATAAWGLPGLTTNSIFLRLFLVTTCEKSKTTFNNDQPQVKKRGKTWWVNLVDKPGGDKV